MFYPVRDGGNDPYHLAPRGGTMQASRLSVVGFWASRRSAVLAEIFVQISGW